MLGVGAGTCVRGKQGAMRPFVSEQESPQSSSALFSLLQA